MLPILIVVSYLIGSLSSAILVCKVFGLPDPRTQGSNNPGTTNVLRIGGKKAGAITLIGDGTKGAIPILIAQTMGFDLLSMTFVAFAAFLGHIYPIFFGFKGGKGVATFLGALFALNYLVGLSFALIWLVVAKVLKMSSLAGLIATLSTPVIFYFLNAKNLNATYVVMLICMWIFYTHRSNIRRMLSGAEDKINS